MKIPGIDFASHPDRVAAAESMEPNEGTGRICRVHTDYIDHIVYISGDEALDNITALLGASVFENGF